LAVKRRTDRIDKGVSITKKLNHYYHHLIDAAAESPTDRQISRKLASIARMKSKLDEVNLLPSQRIETFKNQLSRTEEQLSGHRDPMWSRFLRDCFRILALTFSGVAIYRTLTGQPVNFFRPSHGQYFVEEAARITMAAKEPAQVSGSIGIPTN
jgi:hypothetical protein